MISASAAGKEVQQSELDPQFTVGPPLLNPLAASSQFSVTKRAGGVALDALGEFRDEKCGADDDISERMIAGARRRVTLRPDSAQAHAVLGVALLNSGQLESAEAEFEIALSIQPTHYVAATNLARIKVQAGKFDEAELIYKSLQGHARDNSDVQLKTRVSNNIGVSFLNDGDLKQAQQWFARSIEYASDSLIPHLNLTRYYLRTREFVKAVEAAKLIRARFPEDPIGVELLAIAFWELGLDDNAITEIRLFIDSGRPATGALYGNLGYMLADAKRDYRSALVFLQQGYDKFKHDSLLANNLAYAYLMCGNVQAARTILESIRSSQDPVLARDPKCLVFVTATLTATWGLLHLLEGDVETGRLLYKRAEKLAIEENNTGLARAVRQKMHLELARMYFNQHDYATARIHIKHGFAVRKGRKAYAEDLQALEQKLPPLPAQ
jgi:Flp pilus assembly protein TadD